MAPPLKGTFFALRRRARGGVILGATVVHGVLGIALFVMLGVLYGRAVAPMSGTLIEDENAATQAILSSPFLFLGVAFLYSLIMASYEAALLRWMIRGETAGFAGFSLGGDTWRVYFGYWMWFVVGVAVWILTFVLAVLGLTAFNFATGGLSGDNWWVGYLAIGLWMLLVTPVALRTCTGNAASIARQRFAYFESWRVSRGRAFALLGSFITHWLIWMALALAIMLGLALLGYLAFGTSQNDELTADQSNLVFSAASLVGIFVANLAMAMLSAGTNARAVLAAIEDGKLDGMTSDLANVFD